MTIRLERAKSLAIRRGELARLHALDPRPERARELETIDAAQRVSTRTMNAREMLAYRAWMWERAESAAKQRD